MRRTASAPDRRCGRLRVCASAVAGAGPLAGSAAPAGWLLEGGHPARGAPSDECHGLEQPFSTLAQREQHLVTHTRAYEQRDTRASLP